MSGAGGGGPRDTDVVEVGGGALDDEALMRLARARTVLGPPDLLAAVRHLCTPRATLLEVEEADGDVPGEAPIVLLRPAGAPFADAAVRSAQQSQLALDRLVRAAADAPAPSAAVVEAARRHLDGLAKPPGSLGALEEVATRLCALAGVCPPPGITAPAVLVAAADHGVVASGVSAWPSTVTAAMVEACLSGGAAAAVFAARVGARLQVLDVGVASDVGKRPDFVRRPVRRGTRDLLHGPAMTVGEAAEAVVAGADTAAALLDDGADLLVTGDLGIGNTTAGACLVGVLTGAAAEQVVGPGAGATATVLARKHAVVGAVLDRHRRGGVGPRPDHRPSHVRDSQESQSNNVLGILADCGGLEHAALVGLLLAARARRVPVVLDGVAAVAAALVATRMAPSVHHALFAGHRSSEPAAGVGLAALGLRPLLDLDLRLGEGTGGLLAVPLVAAAADAMTRMATLDAVAGGEGA